MISYSSLALLLLIELFLTKHSVSFQIKYFLTIPTHMQSSSSLFYKKDNEDKEIEEKVEDIKASVIEKGKVMTYGICTTLANEHIQIGAPKNIEHAKELAYDAMEITSGTSGENVYHAYAEGILGNKFVCLRVCLCVSIHLNIYVYTHI
jgi:hypothetical protein